MFHTCFLFLFSHSRCGPLVDELKRDETGFSIEDETVCSCVDGLHTVPRCQISEQPLVSWQLKCEKANKYATDVSFLLLVKFSLGTR